jgi:hypothetical protein
VCAVSCDEGILNTTEYHFSVFSDENPISQTGFCESGFAVKRACVAMGVQETKIIGQRNFVQISFKLSNGS